MIGWSIPLRDEETWHRNHLICSRLLLHNRNMNLRSLQAVWNLDIILVWLTVRSGVEVDCLWPCRRCSKSSVKSHDLKTTIRPASCINEFNSIPSSFIPLFITLKAHRMWPSLQIRQRFIYWLNPHTYAAHFMDFSRSWWNLVKHSKPHLNAGKRHNVPWI